MMLKLQGPTRQHYLAFGRTVTCLSSSSKSSIISTYRYSTQANFKAGIIQQQQQPRRQQQQQQQRQVNDRTSIPSSLCRRHAFSSWSGSRGYDLTHESLTFGHPKVILQSYSPTGFDVLNLVKKVAEDETTEAGGTMHMNGSILAFPHGCFLWKSVKRAQDVTLESLVGPLLLHRPALEYLFIGCNNDSDIPFAEFQRIRVALQKHNIVAEKLDLANAMGTFNILNAEDRQVAAALVLEE